MPKTARNPLLFPGLLLIAAALIFTFTTWNRHRTRDNIPWRTDLAQATADAKAQNKLILVDFTASWCQPCLEMKADTWPDRSVETAVIDRFIPLSLDADSPEGQALGVRFQVDFFPSLIILDADQNELHRAIGKLKPAQLLAFLNQVPPPPPPSPPAASQAALTQPATSR